MTDVILDLLFTPTEDASENLRKEGISEEKMHLVGDVMVDTLIKYREKTSSDGVISELGLAKGSYALMTLYRASNVDIKENLSNILDAIKEVQRKTKIVLAIHPRTKTRIKEFGLEEKLSSMKNLMVIQPLGYIKFFRVDDQCQICSHGLGRCAN